ncbi:hypothetical protein GIB67_020560 [Kingdonia uniflora]|uniref:Uncharacterized protein n=1 Tax=Kingdonia uniflora TaxID=39325 RepID=A0A7J7NLU9_9MAGN|nr:hypothetical protein GIB67_020560 [Kingdonia uniflora]
MVFLLCFFLYVVEVLSASPSAYSSNPESKLSSPPSLTGSVISLVSVVQTPYKGHSWLFKIYKNVLNAKNRAVLTFGSEMLNTTSMPCLAFSRYDKSGNEQFFTELSKWVFHERGHLKVRHMTWDFMFNLSNSIHYTNFDV